MISVSGTFYLLCFLCWLWSAVMGLKFSKCCFTVSICHILRGMAFEYKMIWKLNIDEVKMEANWGRKWINLLIFQWRLVIKYRTCKLNPWKGSNLFIYGTVAPNTKYYSIILMILMASWFGCRNWVVILGGLTGFLLNI